MLIFCTVLASATAREPEIVILSPHDNYLTNVSLITITGETEPGASLNLNSKPVLNNNGTFSGNVVLVEGLNQVIIEAQKNGSISKAVLNITLDVTPPFIEIIKPDVNEVIKTSYLEMAGKTEEGANISVNGMSPGTDNGTWNITIVLSGVNNPFLIESIDKAGNKAEKTINIRIGENLSSVKPFFEDFLNLSINFSTLGKFEGNNDAVAGKYVSYLFDRNASAYTGYSISDSESTTRWFNKISIKGFTAENSSITGPVARYRQNGKFGEQHSVYVEIHDNKMGTTLIDVRQFEDIYGKIREYLMNQPRERLKINVSAEKNVTLEGKEEGNLTSLYINESWKDWPEVTFEPADGVNVTEMSNGYSFQKDAKEAYLFRANYAGGSSDFVLEENKLVAKVNNSLLIFRQFPGMNLTDEDRLDMLIAEGISDGIIGAELFIDDIDSYDVVIFGNLTISTVFPDADTMELNVSSTSPNGTVLAVGMGGKFYNNLLNKNLTIRYDGTELYPASGYRDIMDVTNDFGRAEYLLAVGSNGAMVLVSIPEFSSHIVSFKFETPAGGYGSRIIDLLSFLSAGLLLALPATSRELAFSVWWFAIVLIIYTVIRKAIMRRK